MVLTVRHLRFRLQPLPAVEVDRLVVSPDCETWHWKDEEAFEEAQALGVISPDAAKAILAEGERALDRMRRRQAPFDRDWECWRPDPAWRVPRFRPAWATA